MANPQLDVRTAPPGTGLVRFGNGAPPPAPAPSLTISYDGSATVGVAEAVTVVAANITAPASVTVARISGPSATISPVPVLPEPGALTKLAYATAAAIGTLRLQASATIGGNAVTSNILDMSVVAAPAPSPATTATLSLPGGSTGTNGATVTARISLNGPVPSGGGTVSVATPGATPTSLTHTFADGGATIVDRTFVPASDTTTSVSITSNTMGLTPAGSPQSYTSSAPGSAAADWVARSTASGVTHAENWSSFNTAAEAYSSPRTAGMNKNPSNPTTFDNAFQIITDAGHVLSGKAMRLWHGKNNYGGAGTIDNQYMSIPFNGNRNAVNGQYPTGAYLTKAYVQLCFWTDAFLDYYWKLGDGSLGGSKIAIIDNWDTTATTGELVITDNLNTGFVSAYRITTGGGSLGLDRSISTPANGSNIARQNAIDNGGVLTDQASYERRYGPMAYGMTGGTSQASPLSTQGRPDPDAAIGGVTFNRGGTTVVEVELDLANDRCRVWAAHHGQAPKLIGDTLLNDAAGGLALFGSRVRAGLGTGWSGLYLSNLIYTATGAQNPGYPADAYTDYSEIIVSQKPINFPGGFVPPGTWPSWREALNQWQWVELTSANISAVVPSPAPTGNAANRIDAWNGLTAIRSKVCFAGTGGHADWSGNEGYSCDLLSENPVWTLLGMPSANADVRTDVSHYADGRPTSSHTYYALHGDPSRNKIFRLGVGSAWGSGNFQPPNVDAFDLDTNLWDAALTWPSHPEALSYAQAQAQNPVTGDVYVVGNTKLWRFNMGAGTWTQLASLDNNGQEAYYRGSVFDTVRNRYVVIGDTYSPPAGVSIYNVAGNAWTKASMTGALAASAFAASGFWAHHNTALDKYLQFQGGNTVVEIDPVTLAVTSRATTGGSGMPISPSGVFGKVVFVPLLGGYAYQPRGSSKLWFLAAE